MDSWTLKDHSSFQNENNRKATYAFAPKTLIFKLQQKVLKSYDVYVSWNSPKTDPEVNFLNLQNRSLEKVCFSIVTFK